MKRFRLILVFVVLGITVGSGNWLLNRYPGQMGFRQEQTTKDQVSGTQPGSPVPGLENLQGTLIPRPSRDGWVEIASGHDVQAGITVAEVEPGVQVLEFELPGFILESVVVAGSHCSRISIPGLVPIQVAGLPELPILATSVMIPSAGRTELKIIEQVVREMPIDRVEPSLGHITRSTDPARLTPTFSSFYATGGIWPADSVVLGEPFLLRETRGVNVRIQPLRYDASRGVLLITERLVVEVITTGSGGQNTLDIATKATGAGGGDFDVVNRLAFPNYRGPAGATKYERIADRGRMLIVTDAAFVDALAPFVTWKQQLGITVELATTEETGQSADLIKQTLKAYYSEPAGLVWVILVGDRRQIPTFSGTYDGSDSDSIYAMIIGNDIYPDVFISRISANTVTEVQTQVAKFIAYEKTPATGQDAAWYTRAVCIASQEGLPPDYTRADSIRADLLDYNFETATGIYQGQGGSASVIREAILDGCSVVSYLGHGSGTSWESVSFHTSDIRNLNNVGRTPWIIDISCSNGDLSLTECFAEAWLRTGTPESPSGAVAIISASSPAPWIPPITMQNEIIDLLTGEQANTIGALFYSGLMRMLDHYTGQSVADLVVEQNIIFGDCSLMVRTAEPAEFQVDNISYLETGVKSLQVDVDGPAGSVIAVTGDGVLYGSAIVGADGSAEVVFIDSLNDASNLQMTVSGFNMVPYITALSIDDGEGGVIAQGSPPPERVQLVGNYPNPFNPETRIVFELPRDMQVQLVVYDIRGHRVKVLAREQMTVGRHELTWQGDDEGGRRVASGVYLYRLVTEDGSQNGRMVMSK